MTFDARQLGRWTGEGTLVVTPEATIRYARATNDTSEPHLEGTIAPPMFAVVPALMNVATTAMRSVWLPDTAGEQVRSVHGEHDLTIHMPIRAGMTVHSRAAAVGLQRKSTGTLLITRTESRDEDDQLLNTMTFVNVLRSIETDESTGEHAPNLGPPQPIDTSQPFAIHAYRIDADQGLRYAEASGDYGDYHIDDAAARAAGFPGLIVHGLCTMAFAARAVVQACCSDDSRRLKRIGVRFTRPVVPDQEITTRIYRAGEAGERQIYGFEVDDASGEGVIRRGIAEVST
jgi:acyl dehydratase